MSRTFVQTVTVPGTGEELELELETDDDDVDDHIRNRRRSRGRSGKRSQRSQRSQGRFSLAERRDRQRSERRTEQPATQAPPSNQPAGNVQNNGEYLAIRKDALAGLVSLGGELWAAYHARPGMPRPTGDPSIDFVNAAMHRDALALHDQNRDRIRALSNLAERALLALMS